MAVRPDGQRAPLAGNLYAGLGRLAFEHNRLDEALQDLHTCLEISRQWDDVHLQATAGAMLARLEQVRGNPEEARRAMRNAEQAAAKQALPPRHAIFMEYNVARLWLVQGDLDRLAQFVEKRGLAPGDDVTYQRLQEYVILLRLLLARGEDAAALALSKRLLKKAEASKSLGRVIELLVLQALIFQQRKEADPALAALGKALALARPEKYVRTFIDEGEPMTRLLHLARSRQIEADYAAELLSAYQGSAGLAKPAPRLLNEPLTAREKEVLKLIGSGFSNQAIADKLVISFTTVKRHISNIYTKLDAKSRTQAVAIGNELKLFD
jgi:LuxR family maltose regulon positive regulatory protein